MVEELLNIVSNYQLIEGTPDWWLWNKDEGGLYSVKSAFLVLQGEVIEPNDKVFHKLWSIKAPSNVLSLAWNMLINRVQTKENLIRRRVLQSPSQTFCSLCL